MYRQFNIQQFYALPTHCVYVFCVDLRTNRGTDYNVMYKIQANLRIKMVNHCIIQRFTVRATDNIVK
jgi:hypothetical protein